MTYEHAFTGECVEAERYDCQGPRPAGFESWDRAKGEGPPDASWGYVQDPESGDCLSVFHGDYILRHDSGRLQVLRHDQFTNLYREPRGNAPRNPR